MVLETSTKRCGKIESAIKKIRKSLANQFFLSSDCINKPEKNGSIQKHVNLKPGDFPRVPLLDKELQATNNDFWEKDN